MRQRKTIRFVQISLVLLAVGLTSFGVYSFGHRSVSQAIVVVILGAVCGTAAFLLSDGPSVRIPTPARLDELAGRAEQVAIQKAGD